MMLVYKYPLLAIGTNWIHMPENTRLLSCQLQNEMPTLWALVDSNAPPMHPRRTFVVVGMGQALPDAATQETFLGTVQRNDGIVLHVFEVTP
jgi:hypothetical protein